jgi:hypothetical protein
MGRIIGRHDCDCREELRAIRGAADSFYARTALNLGAKREHHELPIKIPATNTSTPPTTT